MYKSVDIRDSSEVIILDPKWSQDIENLRALDRQNLLACQGCGEAVRVRAGEERRYHFAHKHRLNCTYVDESAALHNARAVLYQWLICKFGNSVTIEKKIDGEDFFRPIDCWVEKDSQVFAYWICDAGLKSEKREQIKNGFSKLGVIAHFIFVLDMLRNDKDYPDRIHLTTTEREFMHRSDYDEIYKSGNSLHFLDSDNLRMLTFRGLHMVHQPQVYSGSCLVNDLSQILVSPKTGELVHPGEYEHLKQYREKQADLENRRREERALLEKNRRDAEEKRNIILSTRSKSDVLPTKITTVPYAIERENPRIYPQQKEGVCILCRRITTDWWSHDGKTGECKCNDCLRQGKFS